MIYLSKSFFLVSIEPEIEHFNSIFFLRFFLLHFFPQTMIRSKWITKMFSVIVIHPYFIPYRFTIDTFFCSFEINRQKYLKKIWISEILERKKNKRISIQCLSYLQLFNVSNLINKIWYNLRLRVEVEESEWDW